MVRTAVSLCGINLKNPIMPASGVFGFGLEYTHFYDPNILGAVVLKGTTGEPRFGNPQPRIAECESGMINSIGLQNPGIKALAESELPGLREFYDGPVIANISGFSVDEYLDSCLRIGSMVDIIELNISCPNIHGGGMSFGVDEKKAAELSSSVKRALRDNNIKTPLFIKLSPNVRDIAEIAMACEAAGADGLTLINTLQGMRINIKTKKSVIANKIGGYSGKAIFPVALGMVYRVAKNVGIPVIGVGGIASAEDVIEMMMAGATAVQLGAENLRNPMCMKEIINELPLLMDRLGIRQLVDIIGVVG